MRRQRCVTSGAAIGLLAAAAGLLAAALGACSRSTPDVAVAAPTPAASDRAGCARLVAALPGSLGPHLDHRVVQPASDYTRAWGRLRCGVGYPPRYLPTSTVDEVDGISWFATQEQDAVVFTAVTRRPRVAVAVPRTYGQAFDVLISLSAPVRSTTAARVR